MALVALFNQLVQELQRSTTLLNLFLVSLLLLSIFVVFSLTKSGETLNLPPSPARLPVIGNLHQLGKLPHRSLQALSKMYGPLMLLRLGQVPTLVVSSAEMTKQIVQNHDEVFSGRPETTAANILLYGSQDIAFAPYGEFWKQLRKISVVELLSLKRVQQFQFAREEEVSELINRIRKTCLGESPTNLSEMLITTASNIMSRCILGEKFVEDGDWYGKTSRRFMVELMSFSFGDFFPSLKWIDTVSGFIARLKAIFAELDGFFDQLIEEHKKVGKPDKNDFVDILLQLQNKATVEFELTRDNLKAILHDMFVAGTVTTSTTMEWLMTELARNPSTMEKVQKEIRSVVGNKRRVDENDITQMHYLKCVIKETLRLHPVAPLLVPRETSGAVELGGYHIPAKTTVFVNAFAIQRDPKFWERPDEFLPDRFEGNSVDFRGEDFQFVPFGGGRRRCPGQAFAVASLECVLANLLYWFDWKLPSGNALVEALDVSEVYGITVCKKAPLYLLPVPYSP
ncbi:hypothetical protein ACLB2K_051600 [Fragaria x ananassa]